MYSVRHPARPMAAQLSPLAPSTAPPDRPAKKALAYRDSHLRDLHGGLSCLCLSAPVGLLVRTDRLK